MGCYRVDYGEYCVPHYDGFKYFNYFEFNGKKYPIGAGVEFTDSGWNYFLGDVGYGFIRGDFRLADHYINGNGVECWEYIIGWSHETHTPFLRHTTKRPEDLIKSVKCIEFNETTSAPGELQVTFKEHNYFPKDWEVEGVMFGWFVTAIVWIGALVFKDWWITLLIQIGAVLYFGSWRNKKINEAISTQKFKNKDR